MADSVNDGLERLQKVLARAGIASRRACEDLIATGRVKVNGKVVTQLGTKINPNSARVQVDDHPVPVKGDATPRKLYFVLHKPEGYLSTVTDPQGRPTIMELVQVEQRLFPIGRLDVDTTGLLMLTNDGAFSNALLHPRSGIEKEYIALLDGFPRLNKLDTLRKGVEIPVENPETGEHEMIKTLPARVDLIRHEGSNTLVRFILKEGKKRQVRLMAEAIGNPVIKLTRVRFGSLKLGDLPEGKYRKLSGEEVKTLMKEAASTKPVEIRHEPSAQPGKKYPETRKPSSKPGDYRNGKPAYQGGENRPDRAGRPEHSSGDNRSNRSDYHNEEHRSGKAPFQSREGRPDRTDYPAGERRPGRSDYQAGGPGTGKPPYQSRDARSGRPDFRSGENRPRRSDFHGDERRPGRPDYRTGQRNSDGPDFHTGERRNRSDYQSGGPGSGKPPFRGGDSRSARPDFRSGENRGSRPEYHNEERRPARSDYPSGERNTGRPEYQNDERRQGRPPFRSGENRPGRPDNYSGDRRSGRPDYRTGERNSGGPDFRSGERRNRSDYQSGGPGSGKPPFRSGEHRAGKPAYPSGDNRSGRPFRGNEPGAGRPERSSRPNRETGERPGRRFNRPERGR